MDEIQIRIRALLREKVPSERSKKDLFAGMKWVGQITTMCTQRIVKIHQRKNKNRIWKIHIARENIEWKISREKSYALAAILFNVEHIFNLLQEIMQMLSWL